MNTWKFVSPILCRKRLLVLLTVLLLIATQATNPALGMRPGGDPTDTDPIGVGNDPPAYVPPSQGFSWAMEKRFGPDLNGDGMVDYHWDPVTMKYDPSYIYPTSWNITFNGCRTANDYYKYGAPLEYEPDYEYQWKLDNAVVPAGCKFSRTFYDKSPHTMELTTTKVNDGSIIIYPVQTVQVKDYFIVSIGDSYASGQGNPDIEQEVISGPLGIGWVSVSPAVWQDERCMRSANAAPALAALALEASDPHSSVTFISFACTGASIMNDSYDRVLDVDDTPLWASRGVGILGRYRGEITNVPYEDYDQYIPAQMIQVSQAIAESNGQPHRQIDALLISGGGNDMKFPAMLSQCVLFTNCWVNDWAQIKVNPITDEQSYDLYDIVDRIVGEGEWEDGGLQFTLAYDYAALGYEINLLDPKPAHVYVTQYPDPTVNDKGVFNTTEQHHCRMLDDIFWPNPLNVVTDLEAETASHHAQTKLNNAIRVAVENLATVYTDIEWQLVDGLSVFDVDNDPAVAGKPGLFLGGPDGGPGHGYCATDNWIRRADESEKIQGPVDWRLGTLGTMHPNYSGQQAIKSRILRYMLPDLTGQAPEEPPSFSFSYSSGGLTSQPGLNGWYLRSCDANNVCDYPKVVGQAVATSDLTLNGASVSVNDTVGCDVAGVHCNTTLSADQKQVTYDVEISATGTYRFQFNAQDANGQAGFLQKEIKVDLEDPILATPIGPFEVEEGGSVELSAHVATYLAGNPPQEFPINDDFLVNFDWDLNNDGIFEMEDEQPTFSAAVVDGPAVLSAWVQVTDRAGRTATAPSDIHVLDTSPAVIINGAPVTGSEGTAIDLTSSVTPGEAGDYTYVWEVKKDGISFATSAEANFSFIPNDNGTYEVSLSVTNASGSTGTASQTIEVGNVAPTPTIKDVPISSPEGTAISLSSAVNDPGASDTFTYDWRVSLGGTILSTGSYSTFSFTPEDNGDYLVSLKVTDKDGGEGSTSQIIKVTNVAPALSNIKYNPSTVNEGSSVTVGGSISDPGAKDCLTLVISWGDGSKEDTQSLAAGTTSFIATHPYADDNPGGTASDSNTITVKVTDKDGGSDTKISAITVNNLPPSVTLTGPADGTLYIVNATVNVAATVTDPSVSDTLSCSVNWGDGSTSAGTLTAGACSANHAFTAAGVYTIQLTATDDDNGSVTKSVMVVVYDPSAGFVTGGGWINSPEGAYKADESLSGKATFGFVSKYQKGTSVPTGNTAFQFFVGGFEFHSTGYDWLVVNTAGTNAQFKGAGMVNGMLDPNGNAYKFMLWATDGITDTFRIRIWWEDAAGEHDVYDNGVSQAIGGGSIVVHTSK